MDSCRDVSVHLQAEVRQIKQLLSAERAFSQPYSLFRGLYRCKVGFAPSPDSRLKECLSNLRMDCNLLRVLSDFPIRDCGCLRVSYSTKVFATGFAFDI